MTRVSDHIVPTLCRAVQQAVREGEAEVAYPEASVRALVSGLVALAQRGELTRDVAASLAGQMLGVKAPL